jgi:hypothetical protein
MSPDSPQNQIVKEKHRLDFFRPGQITFLVTHEASIEERTGDGRLTDEILNEWSEQLNDRLEKLPKRPGPKWNRSERIPIRSYSFPALGSNIPPDLPEGYQLSQNSNLSFSIIVDQVERGNPQEQGDAPLNNHPQGSHEEKQNDPGKKEKDRARDKKALLDYILFLNDNLKTQSFSGLRIEGVFPNWIMSGGASDSGGTGGPGGTPVPYTDTTDPAPAAFYFEDLINQLKSSGVSGLDLYGEGEGVDVIILDTAPPAADLVLAHKELVLLKGELKHRLIETLLGPEGKLKLYPATYQEQLDMANTSLNKHGYKMPDHGLFIAGIIHSIVPKATIHLIEVLNQFGVGDMGTIARGLEKAYSICLEASHSNRKAVINGSWCLDFPDELDEFAYEPAEDEEISDDDRMLEKELRDHRVLEKTRLTGVHEEDDRRVYDDVDWVAQLWFMSERLSDFGRQVVAAAGNQGKQAGRSRHAPRARYPAAFSKVVGVGALPKNAERTDKSGKYDASSYSNLGDIPASHAIMTLGGEPGASNGILGIYLGEFPPESSVCDPEGIGLGWDRVGQRCINGWAWWAGTSFATPILTGVIASVLSGKQMPVYSTQRAVEILYTECIIEQARTEKNEDVIPSSLNQAEPPLGWPF